MSKRRAFSYGWVVLAACFLLAAIVYGPNYAFSVFVKPLAEAFDTTREAAAMAFSLYLVIYGAAGIFLGRLTDRYNPRAVIAIGGLVMGIGYLLTSHVNTIWQLYLTWSFVVGVGAGIGFVPPSAIVSRWFVERRGLALGILAAGQAVGGIAISPLATRSLSEHGLSDTYLILGLMTFVIVVGSAFFLRQAPSGVPALSGSPKTGPSVGKNPQAGESVSLSQAIRTAQFWVVFSIFTLFGLGLSVVQGHLHAYATDIGISAAAAATALSFWYLWSIIGRVVIGGISDRIGRKYALLLCFGLQVITMLWLMVVRNVPMLHGYALVSGFSYGGLLPLIPAVTGDIFGLRSLGAVFGAIFFGATIGGAIGSQLTGHIYDIMGSYNVAFIVGAIAYAVAAGLAFLLKPVKKAEPVST